MCDSKYMFGYKIGHIWFKIDQNIPKKGQLENILFCTFKKDHNYPSFN